MQAHMLPRPYTFAQAAEALNVSKRQVEELVAAGFLPVVDVGKGSQRRLPRVLESDLIDFLEQRRQPGRPDERMTTGQASA